MASLFENLWSVHRSLDRAKIEHSVGGALALAQYTIDPRLTNDIDLNVVSDNPARLLDALPDDVVIHDGALEELERDGQIRLWWRDPDTPLDLFTPQHEYHQRVNDRSIPADYGGVLIPTLTATDLMVFKMLFDRPKDWVDIASLLEAGAGRPDEAARIVQELLGDDDRIDKLALVRSEVEQRRTSHVDLDFRSIVDRSRSLGGDGR